MESIKRRNRLEEAKKQNGSPAPDSRNEPSKTERGENRFRSTMLM